MTRFLVCTFIVLVLAAFSVAAQQQQQQPTFRGTSDAVRVFVTVTDRDGRLVTNLAQRDFEVRDDGKPQPITIFDNTPQPVRLIVMLDVSGSMEGNLDLLRDSASELFARLRPDDEVRVGSFGYDVDLGGEFTHDPAELRAQLPRRIAPDAPTPLWKATDAAMTSFGDKRDVRSVILVLSDGKDSGPLSFTEKYVSQAEVIDRARKEDVMVYGIGMHSRTSRPRMPGIGPGGLQVALMADIPDPGLAKVAQETGGGYTEIRPNQDLGAAFARVADELHGQYLLGYAPPKRDGKSHDLEVKVSQSGLKARARKTYQAPKG